MIKTSIKNFFKSLGFYFIPIGVIAFVVTLYVAAVIPASVNVVKETFQAIASKVQGVVYDWDNIQSILVAKVNEYMADPDKLQALMSNPGDIVNILKDTVQEAFGLSELTTEITDLIQNCVTQLITYLIGLVAMLVVGFFLGFVILLVVSRRFLTNAGFFKAFLVSLIDGIVAALIFLLCLNFMNEDKKWVIYVVVSVAIIGSLFLTLLEAYLFYGVRKLKFKEVFNIKNSLTLLLGNIIDIALSAIVIVLCLTLIPYRFSAIFVAVPFVLLLICVISLNADSYVSKLASEAKIEKKLIKNMEKGEA